MIQLSSDGRVGNSFNERGNWSFRAFKSEGLRPDFARLAVTCELLGNQRRWARARGAGQGWSKGKRTREAGGGGVLKRGKLSVSPGKVSETWFGKSLFPKGKVFLLEREIHVARKIGRNFR